MTAGIAAAQLIKAGKIYQLGRLYEQGMPLFGDRHYSLTIPGGPSGGPLGTAKLVYNDEMLSGEIGQMAHRQKDLSSRWRYLGGRGGSWLG